MRRSSILRSSLRIWLSRRLAFSALGGLQCLLLKPALLGLCFFLSLACLLLPLFPEALLFLLFLADLTRPKRNFLYPVNRVAQLSIPSKVILCKCDLLSEHLREFHDDLQLRELFW